MGTTVRTDFGSEVVTIQGKVQYGCKAAHRFLIGVITEQAEPLNVSTNQVFD